MGGVARPLNRLGRVLFCQLIVDIHNIACSGHEHVWIDGMDEQQRNRDGEAERHVQCSSKMPEICLIDVV